MVLNDRGVKYSSFSWYNLFMAIKVKDFQDNKIYLSKEITEDSTAVKSIFVFTESSSNYTATVKTRLGTPLTIFIGNGGTCAYIDSGAYNIFCVRQKMAATYSSIITGNFGVHNLSSGSTVWTYVSGGASNGTYFNASARTSTVASGSNYADLAGTTAGNKSGSHFVIDILRIGQSQVWQMTGKMMCQGSATFVDFVSELTAKDYFSVPTLYQRAANGSNTSYCRNILEVFEYNPYNIIN